MAKVKTLKPHSNGYGKTHDKKKGDVYDHPSPGALVASKLVELKSAAAPKPAR